MGHSEYFLIEIINYVHRKSVKTVLMMARREEIGQRRNKV